ncbi:unnamed protein product [Schistocephalus solidus]|uniref:TLC domain-containing protein n=1 Tax=Schistocephalus solidus TaxID=70667 RepID=A0A3P7EWK9_SCHSO|nr:unnamed protein product [Schistocephalus solidus]
MYPDLTRDPAFHITPYTYYLVCVSTGYFIYDALDVCWNHRFFKEIEVMLHHFAVVSAFAHNVLTTKCIGYSVIALLVEVNTIFLHLRKLMQLNKVPFTSVVYKIVCAANLITFAIFRGTSLGWITWGMYFEPEKITTMYFYILCMSMFIMNIINPIFFWMLLRRDFLRPFTAKHQSPSLEKLQSSRLSLMD